MINGFFNLQKNNHKGVAGLISIIAILMIFSFATVALLQIEAKQVALVNAISDKIVVQGLSASENLIPTFIQCNEISPGIFKASFLLNNTWERNSKLDSVIFFLKQGSVIQNITGLAYVTDSTNKTIISHTNNVDVTITVNEIIGNPSLNIQDSTHATFVTKLGNKFTTGATFTC